MESHQQSGEVERLSVATKQRTSRDTRPTTHGRAGEDLSRQLLHHAGLLRRHLDETTREEIPFAQQWRACQDFLQLGIFYLTNLLLDRFTSTTTSPTDPTATRRTSFTLLSSSCTVGERNLTYLVELTERGPNIRPAFPERLRVAVTSIPTPDFPTDLRTTTTRQSTTPTNILPPTLEKEKPSTSKEQR